jgi:hypothetical protein
VAELWLTTRREDWGWSEGQNAARRAVQNLVDLPTTFPAPLLSPSRRGPKNERSIYKQYFSFHTTFNEIRLPAFSVNPAHLFAIHRSCISSIQSPLPPSSYTPAPSSKYDIANILRQVHISFWETHMLATSTHSSPKGPHLAAFPRP